eukprot:s3001_g11.t1
MQCGAAQLGDSPKGAVSVFQRPFGQECAHSTRALQLASPCSHTPEFKRLLWFDRLFALISKSGGMEFLVAVGQVSLHVSDELSSFRREATSPLRAKQQHFTVLAMPDVDSLWETCCACCVQLFDHIEDGLVKDARDEGDDCGQAAAAAAAATAAVLEDDDPWIVVNEELTAASFETPSQKPRKVRQMRVNICGTSRSFLELMST